MKIVTGYKCGFCHRVFGRKVNALRHEESCSCNPERKHCKTCSHCYYKEPVYNPDALFDYDVSQKEYKEAPYGLWCGKHDQAIHDKPYFIDCDTDYAYYGVYTEERPVPGTCYHYEYKGNAKTQTEKEYKKRISEESEGGNESKRYSLWGNIVLD